MPESREIAVDPELAAPTGREQRRPNQDRPILLVLPGSDRGIWSEG